MPSVTPRRYLNQTKEQIYALQLCASRKQAQSESVVCVCLSFFIGRRRRQERTLWTHSDTRLLQYAGSMLKDAAWSEGAPQTRHIKTHKHPGKGAEWSENSFPPYTHKRRLFNSNQTLVRQSLVILRPACVCHLWV